VNDVVEIFRSNNIPVEQVETIARGMGDKEVTVVFTSPLPIDSLIKHELFKVNNKSIRMINNGRQLVFVKVHWLPVFASNAAVEALLSPYCKVLDVTSGNIDVGKRHFKSGVRLVKLEVDEIQKQKIPHLMKFQCSRRALLTIQGRPPLCLKYFQVGHYRNSCSGQTHVEPSYYKIQKSISDAEKKINEGKAQEEYTQMREEHEQVRDGHAMSDEHDEGDNIGDDDSDDDDNDRMNDEQEQQQQQQQQQQQYMIRGTKISQDSTDGELQDSFRKNFPSLKTR
jgi:hypothetical protein